MESSSNSGKKRKSTNPPEGYACHLCGKTGHWIFQCSEKKKKIKKSVTKTHIPVPGVDPSREDIEDAKQMQKLDPPNCFCGNVSRLKKVKRSNVSATSRANGNYFFFCVAKIRSEGCNFARPVEHELKAKSERMCPFLLKNGSCKKGNKCQFSHKLVEESRRDPICASC